MSSALSADPPPLANDSASLRRVIFAASLGTLFEWYDFYLYGSLAVFFGGLSVEETAAALGVSDKTVMREWRIAKMWLHRELNGEGGLNGER